MTPARRRGLVWAGSAVAGALAVGVVVARVADATPAHEAADVLGGLALAGLLLAAVATAGAVASLFVHLDPYCWERLSGDHGVEAVRAVPPDDPSGLRWRTTQTTSGSAVEAAGRDVVAGGCGSDRIVPGEAVASMACLAIAAGVVARTTAGD